MIRDFKYIIKRIIIGVGIALVLMFLKGNVFAMEVINVGIGNTETAIDNTTTSYVKNITGNPFSSYANTTGYIRGTFAIQKVDGTATSINVFPKQVYVNTNTNPSSYVCEIGSAMTGNSTFNGGSFTYKCPVKMGSAGIAALVFDFQDIQSNFTSIYRLSIGSLMSYEIVENASINVDTSTTTNAINNQISNDNSNTQSIINNQNNNTQDIIDNQNTNNESLENTIKDQFETCESGDLTLNFDQGIVVGSLTSSGSINTNNTSFKVSDFIQLEKNTTYTIQKTRGLNNVYLCLYNDSQLATSCPIKFTTSGTTYTFNTGDNRLIRTTLQSGVIVKLVGASQYCYNRIDKTNENLANINNTINSDTVDNQQASDFFSNFQHDSHGLSGVITSPLRLLNSLTTASCNPLEFDLPFVHNHVVLPCMKPIYQNYFGVFFSLWQLITTGLISYNVLINLYSKIHNLQNPNNDRIEVLNL